MYKPLPPPLTHPHPKWGLTTSLVLNIASEKRSMSPAWPLNRFWKTLQSVSVSYPYLVPQICPQLGIVQATVILLCSPLIWRAPSIIISRPFLMQCSLFFVFLKNWMAVKLSIYLPSDFLFSFSGPLRAVFSTLFADFSFHSPPFLETSWFTMLSFKTNPLTQSVFCLESAFKFCPFQIALKTWRQKVSHFIHRCQGVRGQTLK